MTDAPSDSGGPSISGARQEAAPEQSDADSSMDPRRSQRLQTNQPEWVGQKWTQGRPPTSLIDWEKARCEYVRIKVVDFNNVGSKNSQHPKSWAATLPMRIKVVDFNNVGECSSVDCVLFRPF